MKDQDARGKNMKFKGRVSRPVGIVAVDRNLKSQGFALRAEGEVEDHFDKAHAKEEKEGKAAATRGSAPKK